MNCTEVGELAPLYLSGELDPAQLAPMEAHLAGCRSCAAEIDRQSALDARLRMAELPDAERVKAAVRGQIRTQRRWQFAGIAATILLVGVGGYRALRPAPVARLYADAALDHRMEVMEHQPRRWRTDPAEIDKLSARFGLANAAVLAPAGYRLQHAKMCGIDGKPALHLVYWNGAREVSVFVRALTGNDNAVHTVRVGSEQLAEFRTGRWEAVVATAGSSRECLDFARSVLSVS